MNSTPNCSLVHNFLDKEIWCKCHGIIYSISSKRQNMLIKPSYFSITTWNWLGVPSFKSVDEIVIQTRVPIGSAWVGISTMLKFRRVSWVEILLVLLLSSTHQRIEAADLSPIRNTTSEGIVRRLLQDCQRAEWVPSSHMFCGQCLSPSCVDCR